MDAESEPASAEAPAAEVSAARLLFRFAVGGSSLLGEWLGVALRAIDELPTPADAPPGGLQAGPRTVAVGALSSAMRWRAPTTRLGTATRETTRVVRRGLGLFAHAPGVEALNRRYGRVRRGVARRLRAWADEGAREELAGRRLARLATPGFFELAVARLSESPELRLVIAEQSEGLAASSVAELRERSELADRVVERVVRRVLRRSADGSGAPRDGRRPRSGHA